MSLHRSSFLLASAVFLAALAAQEPAPAKPVTAETVAPAAKAPSPAQELLGKALRFNQSLPALKCKASGTFVMPELPGGMGSVEMGGELPTVDIELVVALPNRFSLRAEEPMGGVVVCDGKQLLQAVDQFQIHSLEAAPKDLAAFLARPASPMGLPGLNACKALFLPAGSKGSLLDAKQVELLGEQTLEGKPCQHLEVKDEGLACEVWIAKGDEPWVVRYKPAPQKLDLAALMAGGGADGEEPPEDGEEGAHTIRIEPGFDLTFSGFAKEPGKDAFAIVEPEGSEKVANLGKAIEAKMQEQMEEIQLDDMTGDEEAVAAQHESVGKAAPEVTFDLLAGGTQALAELKGKVVLLDFWATWCGPCVQGLPKVAEVAAKLKDQGVVFFAMNLDEKPDTIKAFLEKKKLDVAVGLADQKLATRFGVSGIPHTVVIGKDGVIRTVHVGFGPGAEQQLEKDLRAAIEAGKQPEEPKPAPKPESKGEGGK